MYQDVKFIKGVLYYEELDGKWYPVRLPIGFAGGGGRGRKGDQGPPGPAGPSGFTPFGNDTGLPNIYTAVLNAPPSNTDGFTFEVKIETGNDNTGPSTLDIGLGALPILDSDLNPVVADMMEGDSTYIFVYNSTGGGSYQLLGLAKPQLTTADVLTLIENNTTNMQIYKTTFTQAQLLALTATPSTIVLPAPAAGKSNQVFTIEERYNRVGAPNFAGGGFLSYRKDGLATDLFTDSSGNLYGFSSNVEGVVNQKGSAYYIGMETDLRIRVSAPITGGNAASTLDVLVFYQEVDILP